jgi:putative endonuclease
VPFIVDGGGMTAQRLALGAYGERMAIRFLLDRGLELIDRNWRCHLGEIDAVFADGDTVVFVEVKTRSSAGFGLPAEAVDYRKSVRLRRLAAQWLHEHDVHARVVRFDVISVLSRRSGPAEIDHVVGAF